MKRIVILGSKPNAIIPKCDRIYCSNAAVISNEKAVNQFAERVVVASSAILGAGLVPRTSRHEIYRQKLEAVRDAGMSRIILLESPYSPGMAAQVKAHLQVDERNPDISTVSVTQRIEMVRSIAQTTYPLVDESFVSQDLKVRVHDRMAIWRWYLNWKFGNALRDVSPKYRPSTGILALLQAIKENGSDAKYVLAGIGTKNRNVAKVKTFTATTSDTPAGELPQHVHADLMILEKLVHKYALSSTEAELTEAVLGLNLHE